MLDFLLNGVLLIACFVIAFFLLKKRNEYAWKKEKEKALAAATKEEKVIEKPYTLKELKEFNGSDENKPLYIALNCKVYDVTKSKSFYGKGGSYEALAGHDGSRALASMNLEAISDEWDELSDLGSDEWGTLKDWERQFMMKYTCVGWLVKEGIDSVKNDTGNQASKSVDSDQGDKTGKEIKSAVSPKNEAGDQEDTENQGGHTEDENQDGHNPDQGDEEDTSQAETNQEENKTEADEENKEETSQDGQNPDQGNEDRGHKSSRNKSGGE